MRRASFDERLSQALSLRRQLYASSLYATAKDLLGYRDINWPTHGGTIRTLQAPTPRKLIVMPRGSLKSTLCSVSFPIWRILREPDLRVLLDGELYSNSKNFLREIRLQLERPELIELYGEFESNCWNEGEIIIRQRKKVAKEATITASGIGAEKTGQHYDLIIADDLNGPSNSATKEGREKVIQHWRFNNSILEPGGTMVLVGTRYSSDDCIGHVARDEIGMEME